MTPAIFIDKDGTLITNVHYSIDRQLLMFTNGARSFLDKMKQMGYKIILVTNQPAIAMGIYNEEEFLSFVQYMDAQLAGDLDDTYYCSHAAPEEGGFTCTCRKPQPGMLLEAAKKHEICLEKSWMIGDILDDVEAGNRAGCRTILLNNGGETQWVYGTMREPDFIVTEFDEAEKIIVNETKRLKLHPTI